MKTLKSNSNTADSPTRPDLSKIDAAPYEVTDGEVVVQEAESSEILAENSRLRYENETLKAEIQRLSGRVDLTEEQFLSIMNLARWGRWVFVFCAIYILWSSLPFVFGSCGKLLGNIILLGL